MPRKFVRMVGAPTNPDVVVSARERIHIIDIGTLFIFVVSKVAFTWIVDATHLEIALRFQRLTVYEIGARIVKPSQKSVAFSLCDPFVVPSEIVELRSFFLKHVRHATCRNQECSKPITERLWLVIPVRHLMPPVMSLSQTVMRERNRTRRTLCSQTFGKRLRIRVWFRQCHTSSLLQTFY